MIDTADLQAFLEKIQGGTIPVDLLKIGQAHYAQYANAGKWFLVEDIHIYLLSGDFNAISNKKETATKIIMKEPVRSRRKTRLMQFI